MNYDHTGKPVLTKLIFKCNQHNYLVFYDNDLLAFSLGKSFIKSTTKEVKAKLKDEGIGLLARNIKSSEFWDTFGDNFLYMTKEEISENFSDCITVNYTDIKKYWLTAFKEDAYSDNGDKIGQLEIKNKAMKIKIKLDHENPIDSLEYKKLSTIFKNNAINGEGHIEK